MGKSRTPRGTGFWKEGFGWLWTDTFNLPLETVGRFVAERLVPREVEVVETNAISDDVVRGMKELGLFGLSIAGEFGGRQAACARKRNCRRLPSSRRMRKRGSPPSSASASPVSATNRIPS